jgi:hypothetical protein
MILLMTRSLKPEKFESGSRQRDLPGADAVVNRCATTSATEDFAMGDMEIRYQGVTFYSTYICHVPTSIPPLATIGGLWFVNCTYIHCPVVFFQHHS